MKEELTRFEKRQNALKEDPHGKIFNICLALKMSREGSSNLMSEYDEGRYFDFLETVIHTWEDSVLKDENSLRFDRIVKELCYTTLSMYMK